jgi:hypothetical protein
LQRGRGGAVAQTWRHCWRGRRRRWQKVAEAAPGVSLVTGEAHNWEPALQLQNRLLQGALSPGMGKASETSPACMRRGVQGRGGRAGAVESDDCHWQCPAPLRPAGGAAEGALKLCLLHSSKSHAWIHCSVNSGDHRACQ